jgi:hypothetical protein
MEQLPDYPHLIPDSTLHHGEDRSFINDLSNPSPNQHLDPYSVYADNMMSQKATMDALDAQVPALPAKSSRRMTTLLANLPHKIDAEDQTTVLSQATPHDHYLSSEEDASSSADELSDYSFDSDDELSPMTVEKPAQQITARAISVVYSGKPSIVNLPRRSISPSSTPESRPTTSRSAELLPPPNPSFAKRMSILSFRSATMTSGSRPNSLLLDVTEQRRQKRPNFLDSDPFPSSQEEPVTSPRLQKAPGAMLKRTFNLVKKRSRPHLNHAATMSRDGLLLPTEQLREESQQPRKPLQHSSTMPLVTTTPSSPSKFRVRSGLTINRTRGVKA